MKKIIIRCAGWWKINVLISFTSIIEKKMSPTKLKARPIDNKNKMPHSFKLRMKILTTKPTEICYLMYPVPMIFIS